MIKTKMTPTKKLSGSIKVRGILLMVQVALPLTLYFALQWENRLAAVLIAALFFSSMVFLVWLG